MISAFGVDHGETISKLTRPSIGPVAGALRSLGGRAAKKSGAANEWNAAGKAQTEHFGQHGNTVQSGGVERLHQGFAAARTPKKGVGGALMSRSKNFSAGFHNANTNAHTAGVGTKRPSWM